MAEDFAGLIARILAGHSEAYEPIVQSFQNMAVGYGYALLGDFQLAEDAAQEAFIAAFFELPTLREPQAFPGWFRRILLKQIDRVRRTQHSTFVLDDELTLVNPLPTLAEALESRDRQAAVRTAIGCLPAAQREIITLFYISDYSHADISIFLDIPISTVKMRLYHARKSLQQQLTAVIEDNLPMQRPSRNNQFMEKIMSYEVKTKQVPATTVLSITRRVFHKELQFHLDSSINAMIVVAEANQLQITGLPLSIYHNPVSEDVAGDVEVCLPISGHLPERKDMQMRELPAAHVVSLQLTMRQSIFPGIIKAYDVLREWISVHNYNPAASREIYLNFKRSIFSPIASLDDPCIEIEWPYS